MCVPSEEAIWMRSDSSKVNTLCMDTASPSESNPAPTLALVAGTVTFIMKGHPLYQNSKI